MELICHNFKIGASLSIPKPLIRSLQELSPKNLVLEVYGSNKDAFHSTVFKIYFQTEEGTMKTS